MNESDLKAILEQFINLIQLEERERKAFEAGWNERTKQGLVPWMTAEQAYRALKEKADELTQNENQKQT